MPALCGMSWEMNTHADEESVEDYAERKGLVISTSAKRVINRIERKPGNNTMANGNGEDLTKADLQDMLDQITELLSGAYQPESSREDLAAARRKFGRKHKLTRQQIPRP